MWNKQQCSPMGVVPQLASGGAMFPLNQQTHNRMMGPPPSLLGYPKGPGTGSVHGNVTNNSTNNAQQRQFAPIINSHSCWILFQLVNIVS